jgi:hypothetical protein
MSQLDDLVAAQSDNIAKLRNLGSALAALESSVGTPTDLSGAIASENNLGLAIDALAVAASPVAPVVPDALGIPGASYIPGAPYVPTPDAATIAARLATQNTAAAVAPPVH